MLTLLIILYINNLTTLKKLKIEFAMSAGICTFDPGELAEWSIAAVLKTVELLKVPGVRIPSSPLNSNQLN